MPRGFTLIEVLLYVLTAATLIGIISSLLITLLALRAKNGVISEVTEQGVQALLVVTERIRHAQAIQSPASGASAPALTLTMREPAQNPTIFSSFNGKLLIKEGSGPAQVLITPPTFATDVLFANVSAAATSGTVRLQFRLNHTNSGNRQEFSYSQIFYASASLR